MPTKFLKLCFYSLFSKETLNCQAQAKKLPRWLTASQSKAGFKMCQLKWQLHSLLTAGSGCFCSKGCWEIRHPHSPLSAAAYSNPSLFNYPREIGKKNTNGLDL